MCEHAEVDLLNELRILSFYETSVCRKTLTPSKVMEFPNIFSAETFAYISLNFIINSII